MPTDHRPEAGAQLTATNGAKKIANRTASVVTDANHDIDIEYEYLEFDTPLPHISKKFANDPSTQALPSTPDLSKYTNPFQWPASKSVTSACASTDEVPRDEIVLRQNQRRSCRLSGAHNIACRHTRRKADKEMLHVQ